MAMPLLGGLAGARLFIPKLAERFISSQGVFYLVKFYPGMGSVSSVQRSRIAVANFLIGGDGGDGGGDFGGDGGGDF
jgi:hypothetical protein